MRLETEIETLKKGLEESREDMVIINRFLKRRQANNQLDSTSKCSAKLSNSLSCGHLLTAAKSAAWGRLNRGNLNKNAKNSFLL